MTYVGMYKNEYTCSNIICIDGYPTVLEPKQAYIVEFDMIVQVAAKHPLIVLQSSSLGCGCD